MDLAIQAVAVQSLVELGEVDFLLAQFEVVIRECIVELVDDHKVDNLVIVVGNYFESFGVAVVVVVAVAVVVGFLDFVRLDYLETVFGVADNKAPVDNRDTVAVVDIENSDMAVVC